MVLNMLRFREKVHIYLIFLVKSNFRKPQSASSFNNKIITFMIMTNEKRTFWTHDGHTRVQRRPSERRKPQLFLESHDYHIDGV